MSTLSYQVESVSYTSTTYHAFWRGLILVWGCVYDTDCWADHRAPDGTIVADKDRFPE